MAKTPTRSRLKPRDNGRKTKKKISPLALFRKTRSMLATF